MVDLDDERDRVTSRVKKLAQPLGIKVKVLTYTNYLKRKPELLPGSYSYKYAKGLGWLYDPDSHSDNLFTKPDWETDYDFVVLLQGSNDKQLSEVASAILEREARVGLVYFYPHS